MSYPASASVKATGSVLPRSKSMSVTDAITTNQTKKTMQPIGFFYGDDAQPGDEYAYPGAMVVAGRTNYDRPGFEKVSAAGGNVLIYLDVVTNGGSWGRYHDLLLNDSVCGPASSDWPGKGQANGYGNFLDIRVGSPLQNKLGCVLEKMAAENPDMAGWFADDLGSKWWGGGFDSWSPADKSAYRAGAIALTKTFRRVADEHRLVFIVNGTWTAGDGGGYPDPDQSGNALVDGAVVEHHDGQIDFFGRYACSSQWATRSTLSRGNPVMVAINSTSSGLAEYRRSGCFSYAVVQSDYTTAPRPWGSFHATNLTSNVMSDTASPFR